MDAAAGRATLTCTGSSTGDCDVTYIGAHGEATTAEATVGGTATTAIALPATYCAGPEKPDPSGCTAQPLSPGQTVVRQHRIHTS
jgi:hypothetical protein